MLQEFIKEPRELGFFNFGTFLYNGHEKLLTMKAKWGANFRWKIWKNSQGKRLEIMASFC